MLIHLGFRLLLANVWSQEIGQKWDSGWQYNMKLDAIVPTETCLHHIILDQAVAHNEHTTWDYS